MLAELTVRERVPATATVESPVLAPLIASVQSFLETQTGRYFGIPQAVVEVALGTGGFLLFLADKLQAGTPTVLERAYPGGLATAVTTFAVRQGRAGTQLARTDGNRWLCGYEYEVSYTRGYLIDQGPADILRLALDLIGLKLNAEGLEGVKSESLGTYSVTGFGEADLELLPGSRATLGTWRRMVIA